MMRRLVAVPVLGLALAATACFELAEPSPMVDGRMAHAIPGAEDVVVSVNQVPAFQLTPMERVYFVITTGPRTYDFALNDTTLTAQVDHTNDITAVILMDLGGATLRTFDLDRDGPNQRIKVINAQSAAGTLTVTLTGVVETYEFVLAPGEAEFFDPPTGRFHVTVSAEDDTEGYELPYFDLEPGDFGFLVIAAGTDPAAPYQSMLF